MLYFKSIALLLMGYTLHITSAKALSPRTVRSDTDTFDDFGVTPVAQEISHDKNGNLYYEPNIVYTTVGGTTSEVITVGINAHSAPNIAVLRGNTTISGPPNSDKCVRLKELYFGCTQIGFRAEANLPVSCIMTVQTLKPKVADLSDELVLDAAGQPLQEVFSYMPKLEVASVNPLRIMADMEKALVTLKPAARYKITGRSTDTEGLRGTLNLIYGLNLPLPLLFKVVAKLNQLFSAVGDVAVDILADSIVYETGVDWPLAN